jgi:hypothetical protein
MVGKVLGHKQAPTAAEARVLRTIRSGPLPIERRLV